MELCIRNVSKTYANGVQALKDVTLTLPSGMYGLLGPRGAGKSTLLRMIATLQDPDEGTIQLDEINLINQKDEGRKALGYLAQEIDLDPKVSAEKLLDHFALLKGITERRVRREIVESLLRQMDLWEVRKQKLDDYPAGLKQHFGLAATLVGNPKLIVLDEPTAGLDPAERVRFLNLLSELGASSIVLLATQDVEDVSELCSRMAIIDAGEILLAAEPQCAIDDLCGLIWCRTVSDNELPEIAQRQAVISTRLLAGRTVVRVYSERTPGADFDPAEPELEDVYFSTLAGHIGQRRSGSTTTYLCAEPTPSGARLGSRVSPNPLA